MKKILLLLGIFAIGIVGVLLFKNQEKLVKEGLSVENQKTGTSTEVSEVVSTSTSKGALTTVKETSSRISVGGVEVEVEIRDTPQERGQGLSGKTSLPDGEGMLFIFEKADGHGFWMKDMNFSIDIIWIDANRKIVGIEENVSPSTYPEIFYPQTDILYVLEVPAGFAKRQNIEVGEMFFSI